MPYIVSIHTPLPTSFLAPWPPAPVRCYGGWCDSRRVDISRPGITIAITQPFIRQGRKGYFAQYLEV